MQNLHLVLHVYTLNEGGPATEELDDEDLAAANNWLLPAAEFNGIWESLIFDSDIKSQVSHQPPLPLIHPEN